MTEPQHDQNLLLEISKKLNVLIAISLRQPEGEKLFDKLPKIGETARYLGNMGFDAKDIAQMTGAPVTSVRTLLTPSQKGKSKK
jgi:hypothetical protein